MGNTHPLDPVDPERISAPLMAGTDLPDSVPPEDGCVLRRRRESHRDESFDRLRTSPSTRSRDEALSKFRRKTERVEGVKRGNLYAKKG